MPVVEVEVKVADFAAYVYDNFIWIGLASEKTMKTRM